MRSDATVVVELLFARDDAGGHVGRSGDIHERRDVGDRSSLG
jgi:hypothetical protein